MSDSHSKSEIFGHFSSVGARLDDMDIRTVRAGGNDPVGQSVTLLAGSDVGVPLPTFSELVHVIEWPEETIILEAAENGVLADRDETTFELSKAGGYLVTLKLTATLSGDDVPTAAEAPLRGAFGVYAGPAVGEAYNPNQPVPAPWVAIPNGDGTASINLDHSGVAWLGIPGFPLSVDEWGMALTAIQVMNGVGMQGPDVDTDVALIAVSVVRVVSPDVLIDPVPGLLAEE